MPTAGLNEFRKITGIVETPPAIKLRAAILETSNGLVEEATEEEVTLIVDV